MALIKRTLPDAPAPTREYKTPYKATDISAVTEIPRPKNLRHRVFTNAQKAEILAFREQGENYNQIARRYGTTSDTIRHIVCREKKKRADGAATPSARKKVETKS